MNVGMGMIFDKLSPLLEAGERTGLGVGEAHCALWQTHIGAIEKGMVPLPDLMISSGWYCDQPAEADQLLAELYGIPTVYMDGVLDGQWGEWPKINERMTRYAGRQLEKVFKKIEEVTGYTFTEEARRGGRIDQVKFFFNFNTLVEIVGRSDPQAISQADVNLPFWLTGTPIRKREEANNALTILIRETKERVERGEGVVEKGAPRIYFGLRMAVDASILKMVESLGLAMSVVFVDWLTPRERTEKGKSTEYGQKVMEGWFRRGCLYSAQGAIDYFAEYCKEWKVDGAILCYPYSCRPYTIPPLMSKKALKDRLGIPVLVLEGDAYDTRNYSAGQLRTRVETFAELLKMRKAS
jgi:benzoyl-CoA reductase/2-hydroxyglutaryl-CoA dehydratase subunit BcrC/BadD/HgdB